MAIWQPTEEPRLPPTSLAAAVAEVDDAPHEQRLTPTHSEGRLPVRTVRGTRVLNTLLERVGDLMSVTAASPLATLARQHDMALQTRKRDGTWVSTPVNPLVEDDHVFFRTWHTSGKAKRLRNFPDVRFATSTSRGRPTGDWLRGCAVLLHGDAAAHAAALISRRYPLLQGVAVRLYHRLRRYHTLHYRIGEITADLERSAPPG